MRSLVRDSTRGILEIPIDLTRPDLIAAQLFLSCQRPRVSIHLLDNLWYPHSAQVHVHFLAILC